VSGVSMNILSAGVSAPVKSVGASEHTALITKRLGAGAAVCFFAARTTASPPREWPIRPTQSSARRWK
jgi:hypothetical protein